jgi:K+-sensing histidine kinase KdpD
VEEVSVLFLSLVAIVTVGYGRRIGCIVAGASTLAYNFFFMPPPLAFTMPLTDEYVLWASMLACALFLRQDERA